MNDIFVFVGLMFGLLFLTLMYVFKGKVKTVFNYLKDNLGVTRGIVVFTGAFVIIALLSLWIPKAFAVDKGLTYFNYGELYVGMDINKKLSPQCERDGPNNRLASNGGARVNILRTSSKRVELNSYYLHKSCAVNEDREGIDSFGLEVTWKLWGN